MFVSSLKGTVRPHRFKGQYLSTLASVQVRYRRFHVYSSRNVCHFLALLLVSMWFALLLQNGEHIFKSKNPAVWLKLSARVQCTIQCFGSSAISTRQLWLEIEKKLQQSYSYLRDRNKSSTDRGPGVSKKEPPWNRQIALKIILTRVWSWCCFFLYA